MADLSPAERAAALLRPKKQDTEDTTKSRKDSERARFDGDFAEFMDHMRKFLETNQYAITMHLRILIVRESTGIYNIVGRSPNDIWGTLRFNRKWQSITRGALLNELRRDDYLRPFFLK